MSAGWVARLTAEPGGKSALLADAGGAMVSEPAGVLAVLLVTLAATFRAQSHPTIGRIFKIIPAIVFCYFLPTTLTALRVIPSESGLYDWVKAFVLPASLVLLTLSLDVPAILRLGPKALVMMVTGTASIIVGGAAACAIWGPWLPEEGWRKLSYLSGSWIGGAANAVALQQTFGVPDREIGPIVVVDVAVANLWMAALLMGAARADRLDRWFRADASAIAVLEHEMREYQERVQRTATLPDLLYVATLGFGGAWLGHVGGRWLVEATPLAHLTEYLDAFAWKVVIATTVGVALSFTRLRSLEGAGASKIGSLLLYVLVACIGAGADFARLPEAGVYLGVGATWMLIHAVLIVAVGRLLRAPFFFVAVGSQANVGGAASCPVVAGAFNPLLAPVGVLLAILGYVLGTYGGLVCVNLMRAIAGGN